MIIFIPLTNIADQCYNHNGKNSNKYKLKQKYINSQNNEQEVLEPSNIQGVKIIKENNTLKIENTQLSLTKIIENYQEITQNNMDLANFIENYNGVDDTTMNLYRYISNPYFAFCLVSETILEIA